MKANNNQWKDAVYEILANIAILLFASLFAYFTWESIRTDRSVNHNFADILAEILGLIFILPQVVIQLTVSPEQKDLRAIFKSSISWYLLFYILAIIVLSYDFIYDWVGREKWASIICLSFFIGALLQIAPYLYFFIKKHSPSSKIKILKHRILKRAKKLAKCANKSADEEKIKSLRKVLKSDIESLAGYISLHGNENEEIVNLGAEVLVILIKKLHEHKNRHIDDLLFYVIEIIGKVGTKIKEEGSSDILLESLTKTALHILKGNCPPDRMTKFVLPIIVIITDIGLTSPKRVSETTVLSNIDFIEVISFKALRYKLIDDNEKESVKPREIEYHNIVVQLKRIGEFSLKQNYDYATNKLFNCLNRMWQLSIENLSPEISPILKISDAMVDLGKIASQNEKEPYVFESVNSLEQIIIRVNKKPEFNFEYLIACYLQLGGDVFHYMPLLDDWLCEKMKSLEKNTGIKLSDFFESSEKHIGYKSEIEKQWFLDFLYSLKKCLGIFNENSQDEQE